jgi:predicted Zn-dependent protease
MTPEDRADAEIGKSASEEIAKQFKLVEDSPELPRIEAVVEKLRPVTEKPLQSYQINVIESKAVNAFALPGGYLYYSQGLLQAVESEDELAAVTGHEMAHVCLNHSRRLMSKDERYQKILGPLILVALLSDSEAVDPGAIATVAGLVAQDALNHYGREAELEADHSAVLYLKESCQYNPVAVLTVVEGLARIEGGGPQVDMGVFQTHPLAQARIEAVIRTLKELEVPIERRRVTKSLVAEAAQLTQNDRETGELRLNGRVVFQPAVDLDGVSPAARAHRSAEILNPLLLGDLQLLEVMSMAAGDGIAIEARGEVILTITPADAEFHGSTVDALSAQAMEAIRLGFQEEKVQRAY